MGTCGPLALEKARMNVHENDRLRPRRLDARAQRAFAGAAAEAVVQTLSISTRVDAQSVGPSLIRSKPVTGCRLRFFRSV